MSHMPHTIEAVFFQVHSSEKSIASVRSFHRQLLQRYGLEATALPLVVYDDKERFYLRQGTRVYVPFALASP